MPRVYCDDGVVSNFEQVSNHDEESQDSKQVEEVINIRGDQFDGNEKADVNLLKLKYTDLWAVGLTTAIGSHFFSWSSGLSSGFGSYVIALWFVSTGYFCLILCISELSSALPFAGGAYGIARVTLGIYPGFLIACFDCLKSILCVASAAYSVGRIITTATNGATELQFLYWGLFYMYGLAINGRGGVFFWRVNKITAAISVALLLIFVLGSIKFANIEEYAPLVGQEGSEKWFHGGMQHFMHAMPTATRFFVGIQSIDLACGQIRSPKTEVPKGSLGAVTTVMFTSFAVLFVACSLKPGISVLQKSLNPLTYGYAAMFGIPYNKALCLSLPPTITYGVGYMYFYGKQLSAMGRSGLLPFAMGNEISVRNTPVAAHIAGAVIGYAVCILMYFEAHTKVELNNVVILVAMVTYMSIFLSFVFLRWYFPTIKREFISPLGVFGAAYGFIVFAMVIVATSGYQGEYLAIESFGVITVLASVYYYFVVQKRQVFSEEERTVMFKAYLMKSKQHPRHSIMYILLIDIFLFILKTIWLEVRESNAAPSTTTSSTSFTLPTPRTAFTVFPVSPVRATLHR